MIADSMGLSLRGIACRRAGLPVFSGISLELRAGSIAHVRGPNGSGKSSFLAVIAGLIPLSEGEGNYGEVPLSSGGIAECVAYAGHLDALKPALTLRQNLEAWTRILGGQAGYTDTALNLFALGERADVPAGLCSAGERRRAALARMLASGRPLWLLDEPTASLDTKACACLSDALAEHVSMGGCAVIALHGQLQPEPSNTIWMDRHAPDRSRDGPFPAGNGI